jgi:hypothetical protein
MAESDLDGRGVEDAASRDRHELRNPRAQRMRARKIKINGSNLVGTDLCQTDKRLHPLDHADAPAEPRRVDAQGRVQYVHPRKLNAVGLARGRRQKRH